MNKLVPCAWLSSGALEVWRLRYLLYEICHNSLPLHKAKWAKFEREFQTNYSNSQIQSVFNLLPLLSGGGGGIEGSRGGGTQHIVKNFLEGGSNKNFPNFRGG